MKLKRSYFTGPSLDDLELFEEQLEDAGISTPQIHVLSLDDKSLSDHPHLHEVQSFMKQDVVRKSILGAVVGSVLATMMILMTFSFELVSTSAGWMPVFFLSVVKVVLVKFGEEAVIFRSSGLYYGGVDFAVPREEVLLRVWR